ncbi:MAG: hypothetical protein Ct9H300mP4_10220 [Gammaproteobacteria bacterium]|nr:MAG: hypothetical protein Ct9H300mP4_10220 [Gammaproteobacteria bacterium]
MQTTPKTLFDKIWERHVVVPESEDTPAVLYIDLHLIHEVTTPQAFTLLREKDLRVRSTRESLGYYGSFNSNSPYWLFKGS